MKNRKRSLCYYKNQNKWNLYGSWFPKICPYCGNEKLYIYWKYDAVCCPCCDIWIEKACSDPNCEYCAKRPSTPSEALFMESGSNSYEKEQRTQQYQHKNEGKIRHMQKRAQYDKIKDNKG